MYSTALNTTKMNHTNFIEARNLYTYKHQFHAPPPKKKGGREREDTGWYSRKYARKMAAIPKKAAGILHFKNLSFNSLGG